MEELVNVPVNNRNVVLRCNLSSLTTNVNIITRLIKEVSHVSIVLTDIESLNEDDFTNYKEFLSKVSKTISESIMKEETPSVNILTDRLMLDAMHNCNAGYETITIAPNGEFYICPAFYYEDYEDYEDESLSVSSIETGLLIKNKQLYRLEYAPICHNCDAYQCHRCIWLNRRLTREVNTPGRQQCVISHLERNASKDILEEVHKHGQFIPRRLSI